MSPRVSVGLPVYNGENFVAEAIQSILNQDFEDFELIITDNASTDETEEICHRFAVRDHRIRYYRNAENLGAAGNFNRCYELARGQYFKWFAHDDLISSNFLTESVRILDEEPDAVIAYPRLQGIDQNGSMSNYEERDLSPMMDGVSPAGRFRVLIAAHGLDAAMFGLWRANVLAKTSLHEPYYGSDCALLAEMALLGRFVRVPNIVLYSRNHPRRSVNLHSAERLTWQNPEASGSNPFELSRRLKHLVQIAYRHRDIAPLHHSLYHLALWMLDPLLLGRVVLEGVGAVSPKLRNRLRTLALEAVKPTENSQAAR